MPETRDWTGMKAMYARLLEERTGEDLATWNQRVREKGFTDEQALRAWLAERGVTGYPQSLLVMERFGYPDFFLSTADELIDAQYADRPQLRPLFDALVEAASSLGEVVVQARKTYVSLVSRRRTFARIQPATRTRLDLALRLEGRTPGGRLRPSSIHETMPVQVGISSAEEIDDEVLGLLQAAYEENR